MSGLKNVVDPFVIGIGIVTQKWDVSSQKYGIVYCALVKRLLALLRNVYWCLVATTLLDVEAHHHDNQRPV